MKEAKIKKEFQYMFVISRIEYLNTKYNSSVSREINKPYIDSYMNVHTRYSKTINKSFIYASPFTFFPFPGCELQIKLEKLNIPYDLSVYQYLKDFEFYTISLGDYVRYRPIKTDKENCNCYCNSLSREHIKDIKLNNYIVAFKSGNPYPLGVNVEYFLASHDKMLFLSKELIFFHSSKLCLLESFLGGNCEVNHSLVQNEFYKTLKDTLSQVPPFMESYIYLMSYSDYKPSNIKFVEKKGNKLIYSFYSEIYSRRVKVWFNIKQINFRYKIQKNNEPSL